MEQFNTQECEGKLSEIIVNLEEHQFEIATLCNGNEKNTCAMMGIHADT